MFLKSIEIFGFKSFADKSKIEFNEGISTIVGPNGCGKSNVVDAIRWVLGEQSAKGIRVGKMDNVIFNGTENRHPLNIAEVTLVLSNEDNILPLEFTEVSIKRRIFRSSTSEYYINGSLVTLKELREIILGTGIGMIDYIVMGQGRIDQILEAKPEDRREILEEAAGIKKYRTRSREGNKRREKVRQNLVQIKQILREVETHHATLKQQKTKALQYKELKDVIFSFEVTLICQKYNRLQDVLATALEKVNSHDKLLEIKRAKLLEIRNSETEFNVDIKDFEKTIADHHKKLSIILTEQDAITRLMQSHSEHIEDTKIQLTIHNTQLEDFKKRKQVHQDESKALLAEKKELVKKSDVLNKSMDATRGVVEKNNAEIATLVTNNKLLANQIEVLRNTANDYQHELRNVADRLAEELESRISQTGYSPAEQNKLEAKILKELHNLNEAIQKVLTLLSRAKKGTVDASMDSISKNIHDMKTILHTTEHSFTRYRDCVPTFLNEFLEKDGVLARKTQIDEEIIRVVHEQSRCIETQKAQDTRINALHQDNNTQREKLHEAEIVKSSYDQQLSVFSRDDARIHNEIQQIDRQIDQQKKHIEGLKVSLQKWQKNHVSHTKKLHAYKKDYIETQNILQSLDTQIKDKNSKSGVLQEKLKKLTQNIDELTRTLQSSKDKVTELETKLSVLSDDFTDRYGEMIQMYLQDKTYKEKMKAPYDSIKHSLNQYKEKLNKIGPVNLLAAEEFEVVDERYNNLQAQVKDLEESDLHLQDIIGKIETESRVKLEHTFTQVKKYFKQLFTQIMDGGSADIILDNQDDILESGLEIIAQPPEKKIQLLSQLSGGERTLVALALLFAIHSVKPAPFCVLDEFDATLDEKNVDRYITMLHSYKENTQFIVVSHNKRTIAQAKNIIGVTMEEKGISKILSVRIENDKAIS